MKPNCMDWLYVMCGVGHRDQAQPCGLAGKIRVMTRAKVQAASLGNTKPSNHKGCCVQGKNPANLGWLNDAGHGVNGRRASGPLD
ncbi:hypothetical protein ACFX1X_025318 [Malus domestica]